MCLCIYVKCAHAQAFILGRTAPGMKHGSGTMGENADVRGIKTFINIHQSGDHKGTFRFQGSALPRSSGVAPDQGTGPGLNWLSGRGRTRAQVAGTPLPILTAQRKWRVKDVGPEKAPGRSLTDNADVTCPGSLADDVARAFHKECRPACPGGPTCVPSSAIGSR